MMQTFKRPMRKDFNKNGKLKQYLISLGVKTEINEERFYKNEKDKIVCDVIIAFPDEFEKMAKEHEEFQSQIQSLESIIASHEKTIKDLENRLSSIDEKHEKKIKKIDDEYSGKVDQLKEDLHDKDLQIERTKTEYEKKIGDLKSDHQKALNEMRGNCLKLRVRDNKGYSSYIEELDKLGRVEKFRNKDKAILKEMRGYNLQIIDEEAIDVNFNLIEKEE